ncbi:hypothetical protein GCM10009737_08470 [Nocardioides lentus]|uniref:Minor tail protein n=1 Tax=Nocardioides lentus TaxID=338077 RepID=A0ABP5ABP5_9ACTN
MADLPTCQLKWRLLLPVRQANGSTTYVPPDSGTGVVWIRPPKALNRMPVTGATNPFTLAPLSQRCEFDGDGWLIDTVRDAAGSVIGAGDRIIEVPDLGSDLLAFPVPRDHEAWRVEVQGVKVGGRDFRVDSFPIHPLPDVVTDLTKQVTVQVGGGVVIKPGPPGPPGPPSTVPGPPGAPGGSDAATAQWIKEGPETSKVVVARKPTATPKAYGINTSEANKIGPLADNYNVRGGEEGSPHEIGNSRLADVSGYDNKIWHAIVAAVVHGYHVIAGGVGGHVAALGGSLHALFGGYTTVGGGTANRVLAAKGTVAGGDENSAGTNAITTLTAAVAAGATTVTVADVTDIAVRQTMYLGLGTPALDNGQGPLEIARVASIDGNVLTLDTFQSVATTDETGARTGTALVAAHPNGARVFFSDGTRTGGFVGGGFLNDVLGQFAGVLYGRENRAAGQYSGASGFQSWAEGVGTVAHGLWARARTYGARSHAATRVAQRGDRQSSTLQVSAATTDGATAVNMNPVRSGGTMHQLLRGQLVAVTAHVIGTNADGTVRAHYVVDHTARYGATGNSAWLGTPMLRTVYADTGIGGLSYTAGSSAGFINIRVTGKDGTPMEWHARVELTEVQV